jgi:hypothetical protein
MTTTQKTAVELYREKLKKGDLKAHSEYGLRNETVGNGGSLRRISRFKAAEGLKGIALFPKEMVLTYDPEKGVETDQFNKDSEWRLPLSATEAALVIKSYARDVPETKERILLDSGVPKWNTDPVLETVKGPQGDDVTVEVLTDEDKRILSTYLKLRRYSRRVVRINHPAITGSPFGKAYVVSEPVDELGRFLDEEGKVLTTLPTRVILNKLVGSLAFEETSDYTAIRNKQKEYIPDYNPKNRENLMGVNIQTVKEDSFKSLLSEARNSVLVSGDQIQNEFISYFLTMETSRALKNRKEWKTPNYNLLDKCLRIFGSKKDILEILEKFEPGKEHYEDDNSFDFYQVYVSCPDEHKGADKDKSRDLARNTSYTLPSTRLEDLEDEDKNNLGKGILDAVKNHMDTCGDLEGRFLVSSSLDSFNDTITAQLMEVLASTDLLNDPYFTTTIARNYDSLLSELYGDKFAEYKTYHEIGAINAPEGMNEEQLEAGIKDVNSALIMNEDEIEGSRKEELTAEEIELITGEEESSEEISTEKIALGDL